jgi:hypothetical protein
MNMNLNSGMNTSKNKNENNTKYNSSFGRVGLASMFILICAVSILTGGGFYMRGAAACTDVLNAFLSVETLNAQVKESLIKINDAFQRLDVALSQNDAKTAQTEIGKLIDSYFSFYLSYYQNPPAQFVDDPRWRDKLSDVNSKIKVILQLVNQGRADDAHRQVEAAYNSFSAIYIDRIPMQEQNVFDLIKGRLDSIEVELANFNSLKTDETALHANNLKSLADRLLAFDAPDAGYAEKRRLLAAYITERADMIVVNPPRDTAACELLKIETAGLRSSVEVFIGGRKENLDRQWFKQ